MMASFTSAWLARSRVVVPRNPFLANNSIAACKISCRRSCFISKYSLTSVVSTYLRHLKGLCKKKTGIKRGRKPAVEARSFSRFQGVSRLCCVQPDNRKKQGAECKQRTYER